LKKSDFIIMSYIKNIKKITATVLGQRCAACNQACFGSIVCPMCTDLITKRRLYTMRCTQCAVILNKPTNESVCTSCFTHPPAFDATVCVGDFNEPLSQLISQLKFSHHLIIASWCAEQLAYCLSHLSKQQQQFDLIVPIPLHSNRLRERGFNQSWEIIRHLPYTAHQKHSVLERLRDTPSQRELNATERMMNVKNAFMVDEKYLECVKNKRILLVDDVVTTTATAQTASVALKAAGAVHIMLASIARVSH
jgi:ComF family protein